MKRFLTVALAIALAFAGGVTYVNATTTVAIPGRIALAKPVRVLDTRLDPHFPNGVFQGNSVAPGPFLRNTPTGPIYVDGFPTEGYTGLTFTLTVTAATMSGYIAAVPYSLNTTPWPPTTSTLNFTAGQTVATTVICASDSTGYVLLYVGMPAPGYVHIIVDLTGYTTV